MAMNSYQKARLRERMKHEADATACPVCSRRSAMVIRLIGETHRTWCQWIDRGLCRSTAENDTRER